MVSTNSFTYHNCSRFTVLKGQVLSRLASVATLAYGIDPYAQRYSAGQYQMPENIINITQDLF